MTQDNTRYPVKKFVRMTSEMAALIDKCRYDERLPSENETIRRALTLGLRVAKISMHISGGHERIPQEMHKRRSRHATRHQRRHARADAPEPLHYARLYKGLRYTT